MKDPMPVLLSPPLPMQRRPRAGDRRARFSSITRTTEPMSIS
jgi:hypothetical protein